MEKTPIILFDGHCNLCHKSVNLILTIDRRHIIKLAPLQSDFGRSVLQKFGLETEDLNTLVLLEGEKLSTMSTAVIRTTKYLGGIWPVALVLLLIPRLIRDRIYKLVARNRIRWFGRSETCRLSNPEHPNRFL
jgi:predicted DCC family thiol-disulfide oxidoreductase YuxK